MTQNCSRCGSFNIILTTSGIFCNDCNYPNNITLKINESTNTEKIRKLNNETCFIDRVLPSEYKDLADKINEIIDRSNNN
jgi:hypothetical protein